jgi:hypothetical protein
MYEKARHTFSKISPTQIRIVGFNFIEPMKPFKKMEVISVASWKIEKMVIFTMIEFNPCFSYFLIQMDILKISRRDFI